LFVMPIGLIVTMPFTSYLLSRLNSKKVLLVGALAFNVMLALPGLASHTWQLVLILFCFGSTRNLFNLSVNSQAVAVQQKYTRSIMTTFHGVWSTAGFAGAALGYLMVKNSVSTAWHLTAVSVLLFFLIIYFYWRLPDQLPVAQPVKRPVFSLPDKHLLKFAIICFGCMSCENTMYDWGAIYFQKAVHTPAAAATAAFVLYMICMTIGRFAGDKLVTQVGIKRVLQCSGWLIFAGLTLAVVFPFQATAAVGFAMVGFGISCIVPLVFSIAGRSATMSSGQALASISTIGYLGFVMVPPLVGFVAEAASLRWSFAIIALLAAVIIVTVSTIKEDEQPTLS
jgi:MFS family permease